MKSEIINILETFRKNKELIAFNELNREWSDAIVCEIQSIDIKYLYYMEIDFYGKEETKLKKIALSDISYLDYDDEYLNCIQRLREAEISTSKALYFYPSKKPIENLPWGEICTLSYEEHEVYCILNSNDGNFLMVTYLTINGQEDGLGIRDYSKIQSIRCRSRFETRLDFLYNFK